MSFLKYLKVWEWDFGSLFRTPVSPPIAHTSTPNRTRLVQVETLLNDLTKQLDRAERLLKVVRAKREGEEEEEEGEKRKENRFPSSPLLARFEEAEGDDDDDDIVDDNDESFAEDGFDTVNEKLFPFVHRGGSIGTTSHEPQGGSQLHGAPVAAEDEENVDDDWGDDLEPEDEQEVGGADAGSEVHSVQPHLITDLSHGFQFRVEGKMGKIEPIRQFRKEEHHTMSDGADGKEEAEGSQTTFMKPQEGGKHHLGTWQEDDEGDFGDEDDDDDEFGMDASLSKALGGNVSSGPNVGDTRSSFSLLQSQLRMAAAASGDEHGMGVGIGIGIGTGIGIGGDDEMEEEDIDFGDDSDDGFEDETEDVKDVDDMDFGDEREENGKVGSKDSKKLTVPSCPAIISSSPEHSIGTKKGDSFPSDDGKNYLVVVVDDDDDDDDDWGDMDPKKAHGHSASLPAWAIIDPQELERMRESVLSETRTLSHGIRAEEMIACRPTSLGLSREEVLKHLMSEKRKWSWSVLRGSTPLR